MRCPFFIIISGPTGVGKTDYVEQLCKTITFPVEVINADVGQFYTALSIGTAKPDYHNLTVPQHFFDILSEPKDYTVADFRKNLISLMHVLWKKQKVPLIVGGSGFYAHSLFFPPCEDTVQKEATASVNHISNLEQSNTAQLWELLKQVDPSRAAMLHSNDRYRIERALYIWYTKGMKPSSCVPAYSPLGNYAFYFLTRERKELYERINRRVHLMMNAGWVNEVKNLDEQWWNFLQRKKLIGYPEIIAYLRTVQAHDDPAQSYDLLCEAIAQKTRGYAKRQLVFWKMLKKKLEEAETQKTANKQQLKKDGCLIELKEINLTDISEAISINLLAQELNSLYYEHIT